MKRRSGLVSNSSSSSFTIRHGARETPVWDIFVAAAEKSDDIYISLKDDVVEDLDNNATWNLCYQRG